VLDPPKLNSRGVSSRSGNRDGAICSLSRMEKRRGALVFAASSLGTHKKKKEEKKLQSLGLTGEEHSGRLV